MLVKIYKICEIKIVKQSQSFEAWSSKHHWAFDTPDVYPKQMFEPYFDNNLIGLKNLFNLNKLNST